MSSVKFAVLYLKEPVLVNCLQAKAYKEDVQQLQRFLEMINFYRHFMPNIAKTQKPLTSALMVPLNCLSGQNLCLQLSLQGKMHLSLLHT